MGISTLDIRTVQVMRYVTPLREGGSLPAIAEADDGFLYVVKFRGAGQGTKSLVADFIGGELARACGLKVPEIVFARLDSSFGRTEPDEEIQDLLKASVGLNLGLHYLSGSITYDPVVTKLPGLLASKIVWLDALILNVDRTPRNTNMLCWKNELWLIDHGASLYFHHAGNDWHAASLKPFSQIKDHVLIQQAIAMEEANAFMKTCLTHELIQNIVFSIPVEFFSSPLIDEEQNMYIQFLENRLKHSDIFVNEINKIRAS